MRLAGPARGGAARSRGPDRFPRLQTIGAAFVAKVMSVGDRTVTLGIWVSPLGGESWEYLFLRLNPAYPCLMVALLEAISLPETPV